MKPAMRMLAMEKLREGDRSTRSEYGGNTERRMIGYDRDGPRMTGMPWPGYPHMPPMGGYDDGPEMRRRDDRGRYAGYDPDDGTEMRRRGGGRYAMGGYDDGPEARRRRDRRGRYAGPDDDDEDDEEERRPRMHGGSRYGDIYAEGTIYAPGAMNRPMDGTKAGNYGKVDEHKAQEWTRHMKNADGSYGPHYKSEQTEQIRAAQCPHCDRWEFFVALNMMYSDYCEVAKKLGMDKPDFYAHLAKAFLDDEDAGDHKLAKYMETIPE